MAIDHKIDPVKVRTGLFGLITARLEDSHETAVKRQAADLGDHDVGDLIIDLRSILDEIKIQIDAIELMDNCYCPPKSVITNSNVEVTQSD